MARDLQGTTWNLQDAYHTFGDILQTWATQVTEDDCRLLAPTVVHLLLRFGHALESFSKYSPSVTDNIESIALEAGKLKMHEFFKPTFGSIDYLALTGHGDEMGIGFLDAPVIPGTLATLLGEVGLVAAPASHYRTIRNGNRNRLFCVLDPTAPYLVCEYRRNQLILMQFQQCVNLVLLLHDYDVWAPYSFRSDQLATALLEGGRYPEYSADDQTPHSDIKYGHPDCYSPACVRQSYPLSCIISLLGSTHLTIEPYSWGCQHRTPSEEYDVLSGHVFMMRGNFVHGGRKHTGVVVRMHQNRPLATFFFDWNNFGGCGGGDY